MPLSLRLDHVGPLTRRVADAVIMLAAMAGYDAEWPYARPYQTEDYAHMVDCSLERIRLGVLTNYEQRQMEPAVWSAFGKALGLFQELGAEIRELSLPTYDVVRGRRPCSCASRSKPRCAGALYAASRPLLARSVAIGGA